MKHLIIVILLVIGVALAATYHGTSAVHPAQCANLKMMVAAEIATVQEIATFDAKCAFDAGK